MQKLLIASAGTQTGGKHGTKHAPSISIGRALFRFRETFDTEQMAAQMSQAFCLGLNVSVGSFIERQMESLGFHFDGNLPEPSNEGIVESEDYPKTLAAFPIKGGGAQAPGEIVLLELGDEHTSGARWVTYFHNFQDGGMHHGHYHGHSGGTPADLAKAWKDFGERCAEYCNV